MSGKQSQPDILSEEWFRQVNGLLVAVEVVEHPAQNSTQNLQNGIAFSLRENSNFDSTSQTIFFEI